MRGTGILSISKYHILYKKEMGCGLDHYPLRAGLWSGPHLSNDTNQEDS